MNNIVAINGSPKTKGSVSAMLIEQIQDILESTATTYQVPKLLKQENLTATIADILQADALLIVFPLYVDALPAQLLKFLTLLEQQAIATVGRSPTVYAVCNCGFYEAEHTRLALDIIEHFSVRSGLVWGYGLGIGGGGFLYSQSNNMTKGPAANIYAALQELGQAIQSGDTGRQNVFVTPKIPRFLYEFGGNIGWRQMARKYGTGKLLKAKPHMDK